MALTLKEKEHTGIKAGRATQGSLLTPPPEQQRNPGPLLSPCKTASPAAAPQLFTK